MGSPFFMTSFSILVCKLIYIRIMMKLFKTVIILAVVGLLAWYFWVRYHANPAVESNHQILVERIEAMGKLELVKYRISDIVEHKNVSSMLPDASVLLIVKADAVGCIDLAKLKATDVQVMGDSVIIELPKAELCYVKIDHKESRVYDTKMTFFREADLVDEAYKYAENQVQKKVLQSDILKQTEKNALTVLRPLLLGLGYQKISLTFK